MENRIEESLTLVLQGCLKKDDKYREILYKKFFGYALGIAMLYSKDRTDAMEVVNDSFLKVFSRINQYNDAMPFKGWLRKIVIHTAIDRLRKYGKKMQYVETTKVAVPDETPNAVSQLTAEEIVGLLQQLPYLHRTVFGLYELEGYSHEEVASRLGIPESSSRVYLTRAKKQLRELFPVHFQEDYE
ncbi:MAG: RNA polymerase sigma factor [Marinilabiliales bacterium]|nr:RNA polymerase sigma factor [Marinilabiliales bacterium]